MKISDPDPSPVFVQRGPTYDSVTNQAREYFIHESAGAPVDVAQVLKKSGTDIVLNYLPTGSDKAAFAYAQAAIDAGCSLINCMPTPLARDAGWQDAFVKKRLALLGDNIKGPPFIFRA